VSIYSEVGAPYKGEVSNEEGEHIILITSCGKLIEMLYYSAPILQQVSLYALWVKHM